MIDRLFKSIALYLILSLKAIDRCAKEGRGLIKEAYRTETLALYHFTEVVLDNATAAVKRNAYYNVTKANVMLRAWSSAADADHQTDPNIREAM